jgi:hypothetical protein
LSAVSPESTAAAVGAAADGGELAIAGGRHSREADQHDAADHERRGHGARCALDADDRLIVRALVRRTFEFDAHDAARESLPALAGDDAIVGDAPFVAIRRAC